MLASSVERALASPGAFVQSPVLLESLFNVPCCSIMVVLYRLVELNSGSITLDGIDISTIGLTDLRSKIAIIPQDPTLFSGSLRSNLDPFGMYDDARLWDALKRSSLVDFTKEPEGDHNDGEGKDLSGAATPVKRISLDTQIEDGGENLSVGQRSLVSLARAMVKNSRVVMLDEATGELLLHCAHANSPA
jgi:ABC-type multidrug transport system fused ATPase/permease subunit